MTPPVGPQKSAVVKLRENLAYLRANGASKDQIQAEIARAQEAIDRENAQDRRLSGIERVAAFGSKLASGATFGFFDELSGDKETQRILQRQISEEMPVAAGVTEFVGGLAVPGSIVKAAPKAASFGQKALRIIGEGAAQGALAGAGNAEGGLAQRGRALAEGAAIGGATAGTLSGLARGARAAAAKSGGWAGLVVPDITQEAHQLARRVDVEEGRKRLGQLKASGLLEEATVADVLPNGEGMLRAAATANRDVRKKVDARLGQRVNRLASRADERLSDITGTQRQSARKTVTEMAEEARTQASPHYAAASEEWGQPLGTEAQAAMVDALNLPYVQREVARLRQAPRSKYAQAADDDFEVLDQAYKNLGAKIRTIGERVKARNATPDDIDLRDDLIQQRTVLREAMVLRAPSYGKGLDTFADGKGLEDAYVAGTRAKQTPSDILPDEMGRLDPSEVQPFKEGTAAALRRDVPNVDLGEFARFQDVLAPVATREAADTFKAVFGEEAYRRYVGELLEMAQLQRMRAGKGESTSVDKMIEQATANPDQLAGMFKALLSGNAMGVVENIPLGGMLDRFANSEAASRNADFLLRSGPDIDTALRELEDMLEAATTQGSRRLSPVQRTIGATARHLGADRGKAARRLGSGQP